MAVRLPPIVSSVYIGNVFYSAERAPKSLTALNTSQHCKGHKKIRMTEFHSPSLSILIITQSKVSVLKILNYSNDPETGRIFSQPSLISFKHDKNVSNFLVGSALKTNEQPGTFKCARSQCKTGLFILNTSKITTPKKHMAICGLPYIYARRKAAKIWNKNSKYFTLPCYHQLRSSYSTIKTTRNPQFLDSF